MEKKRIANVAVTDMSEDEMATRIEIVLSLIYSDCFLSTTSLLRILGQYKTAQDMEERENEERERRRKERMGADEDSEY